MKIGTFEVRELEAFPPNENPFWHDATSMGIYIGTNICVMHMNYENQKTHHLTIINTVTGERIKILFDRKEDK
jgi:hypothetical protein